MPSIQSDNEFRALHGHPGTPVVIDMSGTTAQSAALTVGTIYIMTSASALHFEMGSTDPTAVVATSAYWPAGVPFYFVPMVTGEKVAVIKHTGEADEKVYITPMTGYRV
jgi:hypothetical protein